jgi:23S rRNA (uracil1939-C5)-methyltransferase
MEHRETNRRTAAAQPEVMIEKLVYGGEGLGRIGGRVVLVPRVLPGEVVRVSAGRAQPGLLRAGLAEVVTASPRRIEPLCPYFGRCGGCHYQHADYALQTEQKVLILGDQLRRIAKIEPPGRIDVVSGEPWHYRNRAQFHVFNGRIGYLVAGSHRLCPVEECPLISPRLNEALGELRGMMRDRRWPRFIRSLELFSNQTEVQVNVLKTERPVARWFFDWCGANLPGAAAGSLDYRAAGDTFRVGHRSFFQVNRFLLDALVETALWEAAGETALDLYSGVGLFALPLARRFQKVVAVEFAASAANDLRFNAERAGVRLDARRCSVEDYLDNATESPDFVLADPPRAGLDRRNVRNLLRLRPRRLAIVACDPATLARDLAPLVAGGYRVRRMRVVDLFPQTYHLETVAALETGGE